MSFCADLQSAVMDLLQQPGALRANLPLVAKRPKDLNSEILAAAAMSGGMCGYVYPVLPQKVQTNAPFVFVEEGEVRVRILEQPALTALNAIGANAWQIAEDVAHFLHYQPKAAGTALGGLVAHPLTLAPRCIQSVADDKTRMVDVIFKAVYQLSTQPAPVVPFTGEFDSAPEGLQACCKAQIEGSLTLPVPVIMQRDHDLASKIEAAGTPAKIEILPPMPASALQDVPFVFFDNYQVRVRVTEYPQINNGPDAYDLTEQVVAALHWQPFGNFLSHPLQLAARPITMKDNLDRREIEVLFEAVLGLTE